LVADLVACGTGQKVTEQLRETVAAVEALVGERQDHPGVSVQRIADYLKLHKATASRRVQKTLYVGYLENRAM
jgi:predicted transcriptional regulator